MARPRSDIAPRIVRAARRRFLREGVDGASLRAIAKDAKTSIGMIYYYYPTKDDLFLAVIEDVYEKVMNDLEAAVIGESSFEEKAKRLYLRIGQLSPTELDVFKLVLREVLLSSARLPKLLERFRRGHLALVLRTVFEGLTKGELTDRHHPAILAATTLVLGIAPQMIRRIAGPNAPFAELPEGEALSTALVSVLMNGIGREPGST